MSDPRAARPARRWILPALAAALALPGCAVDQSREIARYRRELDGDNPAALVELAPGQPLTLEHALRLANAHNETLAQRGEDYVQALVDKARAAAGFLPTVSLGPAYSYQQADSGDGTTTSHATSVPIRGSLSLLNLRNFSEVQRAAATAEERRQLLLDLQATVLLIVAQTFYQVLRSEQTIDVLQNSLALQAERVRDMQARQNLGINKPLDLAQALANESNTKVQLLQARSDTRNARSTLAFLIHVSAVDGPLDDHFDPSPPAGRPDNYEHQAAQDRRDLLAANATVQAARQSVESAVRQYYPSVNLDVSATLYRDPSPGSIWGLTISGLVPIFSAGLIHADVRTAWSRFRQAVLSQSLVQRQVHEDIQIAYENLTASRDKLKELETTVAAAQRAFDLAVASYRLGAASNLDQLTAQDALLNARLQQTNEQFNQKISYLSLLRAAGRFGQQTPAELQVVPAILGPIKP